MKRLLEQHRQLVEVGLDRFDITRRRLSAQFLRDYERANVALDSALQRSPNLALALLSRGTLAVYSGEPASAIPPLELGMRLDPGFSQQYLQFLGLAHLLMGNCETAATIFRARILLAPQTDSGRSALASTLGHLGEFEEAQRIWAELKKINPKYSLDQRLSISPFRNQADADRIREGLAKAGLPD